MGAVIFLREQCIFLNWLVAFERNKGLEKGARRYLLCLYITGCHFIQKCVGNLLELPGNVGWIF